MSMVTWLALVFLIDTSGLVNLVNDCEASKQFYCSLNLFVPLDIVVIATSRVLIKLFSLISYCNNAHWMSP
jgi:hypothetical protein